MSELCQELDALLDALLNTMPRALYYGVKTSQGGLPHMAKVSWNRTWTEKMRKRGRKKNGKNRLRKKK